MSESLATGATNLYGIVAAFSLPFARQEESAITMGLLMPNPQKTGASFLFIITRIRAGGERV